MNRDPARYSARVRELFAALPGSTSLPAGHGTVAAGEAMALERGAWVRFEARVTAGGIVDCVFRAWGCPHTLAAAAWIALELRKRNPGDAGAIDARHLVRELGVPVEKMGRLLVVEDALKALLEAARAVE